MPSPLMYIHTPIAIVLHSYTGIQICTCTHKPIAIVMPGIQDLYNLSCMCIWYLCRCVYCLIIIIIVMHSYAGFVLHMVPCVLVHEKIKCAVPIERRCKPWTTVLGFWPSCRVQHNLSLALLGLSTCTYMLWYSIMEFCMLVF